MSEERREDIVWGIVFERFWASHEFDFIKAEHPSNATVEEIASSTRRHYLDLATHARYEADRVCDYLRNTRKDET